MYKENLELNNLQALIYHKIETNKQISTMYPNFILLSAYLKLI